MNVNIRKRSGNLEPLDITKIRKMTTEAIENLSGVSLSELELEAQLKFIDGMLSSDIQDALIKTAVEKIDIDVPNWTFVAARLFLYDLYHKVGRVIQGEKGKKYCHLRTYFNHAISINRITPTFVYMKSEKDSNDIIELFDLDELDSYIKPERDLQFNYMGIKAAYDKYLIKDQQGRPVELPQQMFMAIAMFLAHEEETKEQRTNRAKEFYDVISTFEVMLATPTLSGARKNRNQLASCFKPETLIQLINFEKEIKDIKINDYVLTDIGTYEKVTEIYERDYNGLMYNLEICGLNRNISATEEHPFKVLLLKDIECRRGGDKARTGLCIGKQGSKKHCFKSIGCHANDCIDLSKTFKYEWKEIKTLKKGDFVNISFPKNIYQEKTFDINSLITINGMIEKDGMLYYKNTVGSSRFKPILNERMNPIKNTIKIDNDFMLMVGYFLAEGYIAKDLQNICFTFNINEIEYQNFIYNYFKEAFGIDGLIQKNRDNSTNVIIGSRIIATLMYEICGTGFNTKYLKDIIMYADPEIQKYLLVGVIRGDGCAISNGYQLSMSNEKLTNQLFQIALRCGLSPHLYNPYFHKFATTYTYPMIFSCVDKEFIQLVGKNLHRIKTEMRTNLNNRFWYNGEYYMEIKNITTEEYSGKVYNIEVENTHTYVINNISVHNCYIGSVDDNIEGIFDAYKEMGLLSKHGGGIGWDWNDIRAIGGDIDGNKAAAGGPIPFLKINNDIAIAVDQLGVRKGSIAVYVEPWHMNINEFIDLKKNSGEERLRAHDLFPALWIPDLFMERVTEDGMWTLFDPVDVKDLHTLIEEEFDKAYIAYEHNPNIRKETIKAKDLWKKILTSYFESGSPFLCWKDTANRANPNPHVGRIRSSNLCTEIFQNTSPDQYLLKIYNQFEDPEGKITSSDESYILLAEEKIVLLSNGFQKQAKYLNSLDTMVAFKNPDDEDHMYEYLDEPFKIYNIEKERIPGKTAVCNLASINLSRVNTKEDLERVIPIAVRMLDKVIDLNFYPLKKVKDTNIASRAIGLGAMGEAQYLAENQITFGSQEHFDKINYIYECISYNTIKASSALGREKGNYPDFEESNWSKGIMPHDHANHNVYELTNGEITNAYSKSEWDILREVASKNMRNGYLMAIAPTSSISILVGTSQAIEAIYKKKWFEEGLSGLIPCTAPNLNPDTWNYYPSAFEVNQLQLIKAAAIRQKWIDQGQSTNIFISLDKASGKYLNDIYMLAWRLGCKSTYYLRSQSPEAKKAEMDVVDRTIECSGCQ